MEGDICYVEWVGKQKVEGSAISVTTNRARGKRVDLFFWVTTCLIRW